MLAPLVSHERYQKNIHCYRRITHSQGAALGGAAVILFERDEQKDKSGTPARRERPNKKNVKVIKIRLQLILKIQLLTNPLFASRLANLKLNS